MKKKMYLFALCALSFITLFGCKNKDKEPVSRSVTGNVTNVDWTAPEDHDPASSMTAVIAVDMFTLYTGEQLFAANYELTADDVVAAFAGNECVGTAEQINGLFFLFICAPAADEQIAIRYYSSRLKHIYVSELIPFRNDTRLGTVSEPYTPNFIVEK